MFGKTIGRFKPFGVINTKDHYTGSNKLIRSAGVLLFISIQSKIQLKDTEKHFYQCF